MAHASPGEVKAQALGAALKDRMVGSVVVKTKTKTEARQTSAESPLKTFQRPSELKAEVLGPLRG